VVLTFDPPDGVLEACLASVDSAGGAAVHIVVDNGVRATNVPAGWSVLRPGTNLGYAGGMNLGVRAAAAEGAAFVVVLNDDIEVDPGWLAPLVGETSDPDVAAVQPVLLFRSPASINSLGVRIGSDGAGTDIGRGRDLAEIPGEPHDIELFTGGAVLLRVDAWRAVGGFDERYFLYYEDVDLGRRLTAVGWRFRLAPTSVVHHLGSATADHAGTLVVRLRERNRLWNALRNEAPRTIAGALWLSVRRLRHPPRRVHLHGFVTGIAAAPRLIACRLRARRVSRSSRSRLNRPAP
jgi:N-acetylglucosaminyl-diphospho-decaprenol L-rhamnosyltransferase